MKKLKLEDWVTKARRAKWKLAGRVGTQAPERWSKQILQWSPEQHTDTRNRRLLQRKASHPKLCWMDDI
eukprot:1445039-Karenia_brevis.AAC.1